MFKLRFFTTVVVRVTVCQRSLSFAQMIGFLWFLLRGEIGVPIRPCDYRQSHVPNPGIEPGSHCLEIRALTSETKGQAKMCLLIWLLQDWMLHGEGRGCGSVYHRGKQQYQVRVGRSVEFYPNGAEVRTQDRKTDHPTLCQLHCACGYSL